MRAPLPVTRHLSRAVRAAPAVVAACLALAAAAAAREKRQEDAALVAPSLDDELQRVLLEQELMRAERTAILLDELQRRLASWEPAADGGRDA